MRSKRQISFDFSELVEDRASELSAELKDFLVEFARCYVMNNGPRAVTFKVTSARRTEESNKAAKGVKKSAHLRGHALDIAVTDSAERRRVLQALALAGCDRVGIYPTFIHFDVDDTLPNAWWVG